MEKRCENTTSSEIETILSKCREQPSLGVLPRSAFGLPAGALSSKIKVLDAKAMIGCAFVYYFENSASPRFVIGSIERSDKGDLQFTYRSPFKVAARPVCSRMTLALRHVAGNVPGVAEKHL